MNHLNSRILYIYFVGLFSVLASVTVQAEIQTAISPERIKSFAKSSQWQYLLHIRSDLFSTKQSRIKNNAKYFISPEGSLDPLKELAASLETFLHPQLFIETRGQHPYCLFPARLRVLQQTFQLKVEPVNCPALERWKEILRHDEVVLAFASQYLSSPSSMMGHTFLKFKNSTQQDFMNSTMGYAAVVPENTSAFQYVHKGLFGGFIGRFSRQPYYEKVHEYNNMEQRDLWEFVLNLSADQRQLLLEHLWELQNLADFDYYFIDENCAFMMLAAIQVTIPDLFILDHFPIYALPAETAKNLDRVGLIKDVIYRPSLLNKLKFKYELSSPSERKNIVNSFEKKSIDHLQSAIALETLLEKISLERHRQDGELSSELLALEKSAFLQRARLGPINIPEAAVPKSALKSHSPMHVELGGGQSSLDQGYSLFILRPAIHKLVDKDVGYLKNSAFNLMELEFISKTGISEIKLSRLVIAEVRVSNPYLPIAPAFSWQVYLGYRRETETLCPGCNLAFFNGGGGATYQIFDESVDLIPMLFTEAEVGPEIPLGRLWLGPRIDVLINPNDKWKWQQTFYYSKDIRANHNVTKITLSSELRLFDIQPHWDLDTTWLSHIHSGDTPNDQDISLRLIHDF